MKKIAVALIIAVLLLLNVETANSESDIKVTLNNMIIEFNDVSPIIKDGRTLVPFRRLAQALGVDVKYFNDTKLIVGAKDNLEVKMKIGDSSYYINDELHQMLVPPTIINGRTIIPLRDFSEAFGLVVSYNNNKISIDKEYTLKANLTLDGFYALGNRSNSSWEGLFGDSYPNISMNPKIEIYEKIHMGWYEINDGSLVSSNSASGFNKPSGYEEILRQVTFYKKDSYMMIFASENGELINDLMSKDKRNNLINSIYTELVKSDFKGVNLDIEGLGNSNDEESLNQVKRTFNSFVKELKEVLGTNYELILTLPPNNSIYKGYDYKQLGVLADQVIIMAYDYHDRDTPSSNAPIEKVYNGIVDIIDEIDSNKIVLGINLSALRYQKDEVIKEQTDLDSILDNNQENWSLSSPFLNSVYSLIEDKNLDIFWHPVYETAYVYFKENGKDNVIFMESKESLIRKMEIAKKLDLKGIALWRLGIIPDMVYDAIDEVN